VLKLGRLSVFLLIFNSIVFADQVTLKNGDRLTGSIVKSDDKTLVIKTEFAGEVTVQWPAVQAIQSTEPLHVDLKGGQSAVGAVTTSDDQIAISTRDKGVVTAAKETVVDIRSSDEQAAYERSQHPTLTQGWQAGATVGFALTAGNSETKNLTLALLADRKALNDHVGVFLNSVYATNHQLGVTSDVTANSLQSGARYDRNINPRLFAYVNGEFDTDALQGLNLRSLFGAGLGYHALKSDNTTLDFLGGANYTRESYTAVAPNAAFSRNFAAITLGQELEQKMWKSTVLTQKFYFYPGLSDGDSGEYRSTFSLGTVTKINKWLGWQNAFGDIYVSNPPAGKKRNDLLLTTGFNVSFTR
jgi:putative salt-induced outer membrane protein YdiY